MAKNKVDADAIYELADVVNKKLRDMNDAIKDTKNAIDKLAEGDGTISYWSGQRAASWFGVSYRNIANDYVRVANIADTMRVVINYAIDAKKTDKSDIENLKKARTWMNTRKSDARNAASKITNKGTVK